MIGAILGDIIGSQFELSDHKGKIFELFDKRCHVTDDTLMTLAIASALYICNRFEKSYDNLEEITIKEMKRVGGLHPNANYGSAFYNWLFKDLEPKPYNSFGNGAAMRISPVAWVASSEEEVISLSKIVTSVTHNHIEGIKGAEAIALATYLARIGVDKETIKERMYKYYPSLKTDKHVTIDYLMKYYNFEEEGVGMVSCQRTVPFALIAFFEANNFEETIRNAVCFGGDTDTIACMAGSIAEAYYGVSFELEDKAIDYIPSDVVGIYHSFKTIKKKITRRG